MLDLNTDAEVLHEIGRRLRAVRLQANLGIADIAARTGLHRNTILNAEAGANPRMGTVVKILRALGRLGTVDAFLPPPPVSPLQLLKTAGRPRQRARRRARG
jgi:transcriptional regulator with XRE-family HTH domain